MKTLDKEVADIQAAIEAATTLEELVQIEERIVRMGPGPGAVPIFSYVSGKLLSRVKTRATALIDGRSGS